ncbi:MAG: lysophospholipid acyltransferase family protein [Bacteroidota bacterium]
MKILYGIFSVVAWILSRLPFWILYLKSDVLCFFIYHVIGYRKKVVFENLHAAFPEKSEKEIKKIAKQFYRNLCDMIFEVIKVQGIKLEDLNKRIAFRNYELLVPYLNNGKSIVAVTGHCGNWEWTGTVLSTYTDFEGLAPVKPLSNPFFHQYVNGLRMKFSGRGPVDFRLVLREMIKRKDHPILTMFVGDQTPTKNEIQYWTTFLNQDTAVFLGAEKIAKALDHIVVFFDVQRVKRGYYEIVVSLITETPKLTADYEITEAHVKLLESCIQKTPDNWLWSHRRWKHKRSQEKV